jgi:hypothetical protein
MGRTECVMYKRIPKVITVYSSESKLLDIQAFFFIPTGAIFSICTTPFAPRLVRPTGFSYPDLAYQPHEPYHSWELLSILRTLFLLVLYRVHPSKPFESLQNTQHRD